ncbi:MAG: hypothetical protein RLO48_17590, partial [Bauldia litoralis]
MASSGRDKLKGTSGADRISGKGGNDLIFGYAGGQKDADTGLITAERVATGFDGAVFAGWGPGRPDERFVVGQYRGPIHVLAPVSGAAARVRDIRQG